MGRSSRRGLGGKILAIKRSEASRFRFHKRSILSSGGQRPSAVVLSLRSLAGQEDCDGRCE